MCLLRDEGLGAVRKVAAPTLSLVPSACKPGLRHPTSPGLAGVDAHRCWPDIVRVPSVSDQGSPAIRAAIVDVFRCRSQPWIWLVPTLTIVFTAVSTVFLVKPDSALRVVLGVVALLGALVIQATISWADRENEQGEKTAAERLRVAMKDALQPVAELSAEMPALTPVKRAARLREVAQQAVSALCLLLKDVDRLRAVVYEVDPSGTSMSCLAYHGRGATPKGFEAGTPRGDSALDLVRHAGYKFAADLATARPADYGGTVSDYRTFTSAAISNGPNAYGMVTVDAPNAGDLVDTDAQLVLLMADLLSIAFAVADQAK